jgi:NADH pyrophosphatase NudC (nudix superfamily)
MEPDETFEETITRELMEELGIKVNHLNFLKVFSGKDYYHEYPNGDKVFSVIALFEGEGVVGDLAVDNKEIKTVELFNTESLPKELTMVTSMILNGYST